MLTITGLLNFVVSIYMMLIFFRILLTWFTGMGRGKVQDILEKITDPYLNWFRQFKFLRTGNLDLSPIAALGILSLVSRILNTAAFYGKITIGIILALLLQTVWGAVSFIIGFLIIVLALRLVIHLLGNSTSSPFMRVTAAISEPVLFRINRVLFRNRIVNFKAALAVSIAGLGLIYIALRILVTIASGMLIQLPL